MEGVNAGIFMESIRPRSGQAFERVFSMYRRNAMVHITEQSLMIDFV